MSHTKAFDAMCDVLLVMEEGLTICVHYIHKMIMLTMLRWNGMRLLVLPRMMSKTKK